MPQHSRSGLFCLRRLLRSAVPTRGVVARRAIVVPLLVFVLSGVRFANAADAAEERFDQTIQPILERYCYTCHGDGIKKGGVDFDGIDVDRARLRDRDLWRRVLRNARAGLMPPLDKPRPTVEEMRLLEDWIKFDAFGIDPKNPDPGRVAVRRLNRIEYRNTIRDLLGVDYDTAAEFPPDDTGHGFDNIGDVLTLSPLLLEKYLAAAEAIVSKTVPTHARVVAEKTILGRSFRRPEAEPAEKDEPGPLSLSYYEPATVATTIKEEHAGRYRLVLEISANEKFVDGVFDYNKCRLIYKVDGKELLRRDFVRQEGRSYVDEFDQDWEAGPHTIALELQPLTPGKDRVRSLTIRIKSATVRGPFDERFYVRAPGYETFFPRAVADDLEGRRRYARELLGRFAARAYRRPASAETSDRLVGLAEQVWTERGKTFEEGVARGMTAILTSPRFLFREEDVEADSADRYPLVDEYSLAARLSYFLWSTMPDAELTQLAEERKLRQNLHTQVKRMLADPRSAEFIRNFVGQWLQARDIDKVPINAFAVIARDQPPDPEADRRRARFRELIRKNPDDLTDKEKQEMKDARATFFRSRRSREFDLTPELRQAMRRETELVFEYVVRENRGLTELLDCDYTFLNERLAKHYGIDGVKGGEMRRVVLPADSPRGGLLTQGTMLVVTSNPDRTSPVKRGLFILDNILGSPPAPPPPNIPPLEDSGKAVNGRLPTLRESLALHRSRPSCASCHARMDPLGLAFENFNALGRWRDKERTDPIDSTGRLITGESFRDVRELKRILVHERRRDFYRCLTEKMLTYALGRGLEAIDEETADALVERLEKAEGRASTLLLGIVDSAQFQRRRKPNEENSNGQAHVEAGDRP